MLVQTAQGPPAAPNGTGTTPTLRSGPLGELIVQELHGRYYEQTYRKNLMRAFAQGQTLSLAGTAMTGLILFNPANSGINLTLQKVMAMISVASASLTGIGLCSTVAGSQTTVPTTTTGPTSSGNNFLGAAAGLVQPFTVATTFAQTVFAQLLHNTASIQTVGVDQCVMDFEGSIIVPPATAIALCALGAASAAAALTATMFWEETPV
jgi:hypothetical protein